MRQSNAKKYFMVDQQTGMKLYAPDNISAEQAEKFNMQAEAAPSFARLPNEKPKNPFETRGKSDFADRKGNPAFTQFKNVFEPTPDPVKIAAQEVVQADSKEIKTNVASVINEKIEKKPKVVKVDDDSWENMRATPSVEVSAEENPVIDESAQNKVQRNVPELSEEAQVTRKPTAEDTTKSAAATIQGTSATVKDTISEVRRDNISPDAFKFEKFYGEENISNLSDQKSSEFVKNQKKEATEIKTIIPELALPPIPNINQNNFTGNPVNERRINVEREERERAPIVNINDPKRRAPVLSPVVNINQKPPVKSEDDTVFIQPVPSPSDNEFIVEPQKTAVVQPASTMSSPAKPGLPASFFSPEFTMDDLGEPNKNVFLSPPDFSNLLPTQPIVSPPIENINLRTGDFQDQNQDGIDDRDQPQPIEIRPPIENINVRTGDFQDQNQDGIDDRDQIPKSTTPETPVLTPEPTSDVTTQTPPFNLSNLPYGGLTPEQIAAIKKYLEEQEKQKQEPPNTSPPPEDRPPTETTIPNYDLGPTQPSTGDVNAPTSPGTQTDTPSTTTTAVPITRSIANYLSRVFTGKPVDEEPSTSTKTTPQTAGMTVSSTQTQNLTPSSQPAINATLSPASVRSSIIDSTENILRNQAENASLTSPVSVAQSQQPVIINNTTMIPQPQATDKTKEVFSDESTFTRLTAMDVYHPSGYPGFRYG